MIGEDNIREYLTAFADGELDAGQILSVLDYLAEHPEGLQLMRTQQRLRIAAERAIRASTPPLPEQLRRRLEALVPQPTSETTRPWYRRIGWGLPLAAAAFLLTGLIAGRTLLAPNPDARRHEFVEADAPIPATTVAHATRIHADCSRLQRGLHTAGYPRELAGLADSVAKDLGESSPYPNLSKIGYAYVGAGPCEAPLADTVHLLYQSTKPGHKRTVSVFAQPFKDQFRLNPGKLYDVAGPRSPFPLYAWRTEHVVYFLIADNESAIREARQAIAMAPPL